METEDVSVLHLLHHRLGLPCFPYSQKLPSILSTLHAVKVVQITCRNPTRDQSKAPQNRKNSSALSECTYVKSSVPYVPGEVPLHQ